MIPLPLLEDRASASFENQALSTPDFHSAETLLFFIHDAPDVWSNPHPNHNRIQLHDSFLVSVHHHQNKIGEIKLLDEEGN